MPRGRDLPVPRMRRAHRPAALRGLQPVHPPPPRRRPLPTLRRVRPHRRTTPQRSRTGTHLHSNLDKLTLLSLAAEVDGGASRPFLYAMTRYLLGDQIADSLRIPRARIWDQVVRTS